MNPWSKLGNSKFWIGIEKIIDLRTSKKRAIEIDPQLQSHTKQNIKRSKTCSLITRCRISLDDV